MNIRGIIFDLDGVICHTDKYHYQAWKKIADEEKIEFNEVINERLRGVSRAESLEIILEKASKEYSQEEKQHLMDKKNNIYRSLLKGMSPSDVSTEIRVTLNKLKEKGYKLAIGSSSKNTMLILSQLGLKDFFDGIADGTKITNSKPDPEVFLKAAELIKENPDNCMVVEDANAGIDAASAGGFHNIGIGPARYYSKAEYKVKSFGQILDLI